MTLHSTGLRPETAVIRLWQLRLDVPAAELARLTDFLAPVERERAARFRFRRDRDRYVAGRGQLRRVLGELTETHPAKLRLTTNAFGKPQLPGSGWFFNLAHAEGTALLAAASTGPVGVDLEPTQAVPDRDLVATSFFSDREVTALRQLPESERDAAFLRCWTRKEAYVKAVGGGLSMDLRDFAVALDAGELPAMVWSRDPAEAGRWSVTDLSAYVPGHVAALVVAGPAPQIHPVKQP